MDVYKGLVKGVSDGGRGLQKNDDHGDGSEEAILQEMTCSECFVDAVISFSGMHVNAPCQGMGNHF